MNHSPLSRRFLVLAPAALLPALLCLGSLSALAQNAPPSTPAAAPTTAPTSRPLVTRAPFGGKAATIPGRIEAENFDEGPEGVAYHDRTPDCNEGAGYRLGVGVDIKGMIDVPGRKFWYRSMESTPSIGWFFIDEWLTYSVDVKPGTYDIHVRYGTPMADKVLNLSLGDTLLASVPTPSTTGYTVWKTATFRNVKIDVSGRHILRIQPGGNPKDETDIDWIEFTPAGTAPTP